MMDPNIIALGITTLGLGATTIWLAATRAAAMARADLWRCRAEILGRDKLQRMRVDEARRVHLRAIGIKGNRSPKRKKG